MKKLLVCMAMSAVLMTGCSFLQKDEGIIKVNDQIITQAQFDKAFDRAVDASAFKSFGGSKNFIKSDENPMYGIFKHKVVSELIVKAIIDDEIAKRGITASKEEIQNELKSVIDKVGSKEELNRILKQRGVSNNEFMQDLETQAKIRKLVNSIQKIEVSDSEAEKYYNENKQSFTHGEQVRASHILVSADVLSIIQQIREKNPDITPEQLNTEVEKRVAAQKAKAEAILAEVKKNPQDFEKIAKQKSDDKASGERGGELGFFPRQAMVKEFSDAAFSMKPDTISDLVKTNFGFHIIKVTDRMESGTTPFAKVKDEIKYYLETKKQLEVLRNLTEGLIKNAQIEYLNDSFNPAKASQINIEQPQPLDAAAQK